MVQQQTQMTLIWLPWLLVVLETCAGAAAGQLDHRCQGVSNNTWVCSGCSPEFAKQGQCTACLAETLNAGPLCRKCQGGMARGPSRAVTCDPLCFYCKDCDLTKLQYLSAGAIATCVCDMSQLRMAYSMNQAAHSFDGSHGILSIQPGNNRSGVIDGCHVEVGCIRRRNVYQTELFSSSCPSSNLHRNSTIMGNVSVNKVSLNEISATSAENAAHEMISLDTSFLNESDYAYLDANSNYTGIFAAASVSAAPPGLVAPAATMAILIIASVPVSVWQSNCMSHK